MPGLLIVSLAAAACADSTGVNKGLTADESTQLAGLMADDAFSESSTMALASLGTTTGEIGPAAVLTVTFHDTVSCRLGGDVAIDGTRVREWDRTTQTGTMDMDLTRTQESCVRAVGGPGHAHTDPHRHLLQPDHQPHRHLVQRLSLSHEGHEGTAGHTEGRLPGGVC
ncbi:MAG: hypothetical protein P8Z36_17225 [Gemmatimonadota bacterium]